MALINLGTLTIPSGQTASNILGADGQLRYIESLTFRAPATLPETVTVEVTEVKGAPQAGDWTVLQSEGADVTLPAGKATPIVRNPAIRQLRLVAGVAVAADRSFPVSAQDSF